MNALVLALRSRGGETGGRFGETEREEKKKKSCRRVRQQDTNPVAFNIVYIDRRRSPPVKGAGVWRSVCLSARILLIFKMYNIEMSPSVQHFITSTVILANNDINFTAVSSCV